MNWINAYRAIIVIGLLIPNIIYALKNKNLENKCKNKVMNIVEQVGRYGSMALMIFNLGMKELAFKSNEIFVLWLICTIILLLLYWLFWMVYSKAPKLFTAILLAVIPSMIFITNGLFLRQWLLVLFGVIFLTGHSYVTYENNK